MTLTLIGGRKKRFELVIFRFSTWYVENNPIFLGFVKQVVIVPNQIELIIIILRSFNFG